MDDKYTKNSPIATTPESHIAENKMKTIIGMMKFILALPQGEWITHGRFSDFCEHAGVYLVLVPEAVGAKLDHAYHIVGDSISASAPTGVRILVHFPGTACQVS